MTEQETTQKKGKSFTDKLWDALASVKFAIILFALIGLTSMVGTVIEQNGDPSANLRIIAKFVGMGAAPGVYGVLESLGFMDMYKSWWFNGLLALFAVNLIICSLDRFPRVWRMIRKPLTPLKESHFRSFSIKREFALKGTGDSMKALIVEALTKLGIKKVETVEEDGQWQAFGQRQVYSHLGVYFTHLSVIVILLGAVIGFFFGFKGYMNLPEGATYAVAYGRQNITNQQFQERGMLLEALSRSNGNAQEAAAAIGVTEDRFTSRLSRLGAEPLGFLIRNEDFQVSFYGQTYQAKEYSSLLTIFDEDRQVVQKRIEVNSPLKYKGFTFYQSSYGPMDNPEEFVYIFDAVPAGGQPKRLEVSLREPFQIPGSGITLTVERFIHTAQFDANGRAYPDPRDSLIMANPALQVRVEKDGKSFTKWVLGRHPQTWEIMDGHRLEYVDVWGAEFTGLQVRRDPGVWIVYLGCLIMSIGLYVAFFMSHRRVWISLSGGDKGTGKVLLAASAHKGREGLERRIDETITLITEGGK